MNNQIEVAIEDMRVRGPKLNLTTTSVSSLDSFRISINQIDQAITRCPHSAANRVPS